MRFEDLGSQALAVAAPWCVEIDKNVVKFGYGGIEIGIVELQNLPVVRDFRKGDVKISKQDDRCDQEEEKWDVGDSRHRPIHCLFRSNFNFQLLTSATVFSLFLMTLFDLTPSILKNYIPNFKAVLRI